jgi:hypothetical protein
MGSLFLLMALVVLVGALLMRGRTRDAIRGGPTATDDPLLRELLGEAASGYDEGSDPLDEERARAEEDRFWDEGWDEPEEWRG